MAELTIQLGENGLHFVTKPVNILDKETNTKKFVGNFDFVRYLTIDELVAHETSERILATFHASNDIDLQASYRGNKTSKKVEKRAALAQAFSDYKAGIITEAAYLHIMQNSI